MTVRFSVQSWGVKANKAGGNIYGKLHAVASKVMPHPFSTGGSASTDVETASASQVALVPQIIQTLAGWPSRPKM